MANEQDAKKEKEEAKDKDKSKETPKDDSKKEGKDPKDANPTDVDGAPKEISSKKLIILMSAAFAVILVITVILLIVVLKPASKTEDQATGDHAEKAHVQEHGETKASTTEAAKGAVPDETATAKAVNPVYQAQFIKVEPSFVVNFMNTQNIKFLEVAVTLVAKTDREAALVKNNMPFIKDQLVTLFSAQKYDDIRTQQGKDMLRAGALTIIQQILEKQSGEKCVSDILFTSFVMQ